MDLFLVNVIWGANCRQLLHVYMGLKITIEFLSSEFLVEEWLKKHYIPVSALDAVLGIYENGSLVLLDLLVGTYVNSKQTLQCLFCDLTC